MIDKIPFFEYYNQAWYSDRNELQNRKNNEKLEISKIANMSSLTFEVDISVMEFDIFFCTGDLKMLLSDVHGNQNSLKSCVKS